MSRIGEELGERYRLDELIGSGGFAAVYRARDLRLERDVAVKVLVANHAADPDVAARFDREARVLAAVRHPNVVTIHDVAVADPATGAEPFLVMDLCEGGSLAARLAASGSGALPPEELVPILVDVAEGLAALHAQGIVHRDLKPSNVLLSDGRARIADLGIAASGPSELTATGATVGTLGYLAPEQLAGEPGSHASDVHALGTMAFLGLTGRLPREASSYAEVVAASVRPVARVSTVAPELGSGFDAPVAQALAMDPAERPHALEFGEAMAAAFAGGHEPTDDGVSDATTVITVLPDSSVAPVLPGPPMAPVAAETGPRRMGRWMMALVVALAALVIGMAAFVLMNADGSNEPASPTPTASLNPGPTGGASPSPAETVDPYADARAASDQMRAAIADSRGADGLNGREARDLEEVLDRFERALDDGDPAKARDEAHELSSRVDKLIEKDAVDAESASRLSAAAEGLVAAADALAG